MGIVIIRLMVALKETSVLLKRKQYIALNTTIILDVQGSGNHSYVNQALKYLPSQNQAKTIPDHNQAHNSYWRNEFSASESVIILLEAK